MQNLASTERAALERITHDPMLAQVQQWAAINSGSGNLAGLKATADLLADAFAILPGNIELQEPAPVEKVRADGVVEIVEHGRHLVVTVRPEAPVQLLFTGHMDTVFPADHNFQEQRWLEDGVLNGPGVADMKGGIAVMLAALAAAETAPEFANVGYQVMINSDEEVGSPSSAPLITALAKGKTAALTYEPALPDGTLAGERGGSGNFSIIFTGKSAHAGRNPQDGRNALLAAADLALRLKALTRPGLNVNPARIEGGSPNNVVPDHAILRVNFRPMTPQIVEETDLALRTLIADIEREHDVSAHLHGSFGRPPKPIDAGAAKLFDLVKQCGADLGLSIAWKASGGVCDGNNIAACGIPVVDTMGVRGGAIHSADEFLITESLVERARLSALTILRIAKKGAL
ncbi:hydrolase [Sphingorhabdus lacus]|uniref:Hydrolase n=1 Tax=Sphingorhabdus lacus TaxID=392610 RepID=A0A6I6LCI2_9SPHN|nr:hydrolase [Sphingorhabdus lacus]QGY80182.1 hydrolase [Sphingorhabdus lacus]